MWVSTWCLLLLAIGACGDSSATSGPIGMGGISGAGGIAGAGGVAGAAGAAGNVGGSGGTGAAAGADGTAGDGGAGGTGADGEGGADGWRLVAFTSAATNLVDDDTNRRSDIFVHDRMTATTTRVSLCRSMLSCAMPGQGGGDDDSETPVLSADGGFVAFTSRASNLERLGLDSNAREDVFIHDRTTGTTSRVSVSGEGAHGDGGSWSAAIVP